MFWPVAADLANVTLTKDDMERVQKNVKAEIEPRRPDEKLTDSEFNLASKDKSVQ